MHTCTETPAHAEAVKACYYILNKHAKLIAPGREPLPRREDVLRDLEKLRSQGYRIEVCKHRNQQTEVLDEARRMGRPFTCTDIARAFRKKGTPKSDDAIRHTILRLIKLNKLRLIGCMNGSIAHYYEVVS